MRETGPATVGLLAAKRLGGGDLAERHDRIYRAQLVTKYQRSAGLQSNHDIILVRRQVAGKQSFCDSRLPSLDID